MIRAYTDTLSAVYAALGNYLCLAVAHTDGFRRASLYTVGTALALVFIKPH